MVHNERFYFGRANPGSWWQVFIHLKSIFHFSLNIKPTVCKVSQFHEISNPEKRTRFAIRGRTMDPLHYLFSVWLNVARTAIVRGSWKTLCDRGSSWVSRLRHCCEVERIHRFATATFTIPHLSIFGSHGPVPVLSGRIWYEHSAPA